MNTCISAVQHLRPLRGGAQSHLLKASDGACYVTKFQNNPQHVRVLANEMLATNLGLALGLPMPRVEVIEVSDWLIEHTEDLRISLGGAKIPCRSGKQLGSLYVGCESPGMTFDYLPRELLEGVRNLERLRSGSCPGQVDVQQRWTAGDLLRKTAEKPAIPRNLHRPGLLLQCRRVEFPGLSAPRCIREQLCIRECHGMGGIRTSTDQSRRDGFGHHLAVCCRDSGRVVRRRSRRSESVGGRAAPSPWGDSEVDRRIS